MLGFSRQRRGPIAMKTLPLSRPGDTLECKTEERCPGTPALIGASLCTRVPVHGETPGLALLSCFPLTLSAPGLLPHAPTALGSFHAAPGEEAALCEHPWWRHPLPLSSSSLSLNSNFHHRCDNQTTVTLGWMASQG